MKRLLFAILVLMLPFMAAQAGAINEEKARQKASAFLSVRKGRQIRSVSGHRTGLSLTLADVNQQDAFFIFNVGNGDGFVIVSASDRTDDILGYSDSGSFDRSELPDALRAWLDDYRCQIDYLEHHGTISRENAAPRRASRTSVPILLKSQWNQEQPFNNLCPVFKDVHAATGCVPTAMAQLMYYHKYPATAPAMDGYQSRTSSFGEIDMPELPATTFDWSKMYDTYKRGEDGSEVARLMLYCGQAVQVDYGKYGSSATADVALSKLVEVFGYDAGIRSISRSDYYNDEWTQLIYNELAAFRPVLLSGQSAGGGHAFICDGYDSSTGMFHINWGWGGLSDGFFRLSLLNPDDQGTGGSNSSDGNSFSLSAGIGIQPDTGKPALVSNALTVVSLTLAGSESNTLTRPDESSNFSILPYLNLMNLSGRSHTYNIGVRLRRDNTVLRTDAWSEGIVLDSNRGRSEWHTFRFGQGLTDGTYRLEAVYQADDDAEWNLCNQGDGNYLELTIDGTELTVNSVNRKTYQLEVQSVSYAHTEVTQGEPEEVTIAVRNIGGKPYHGDITFLTLKDGIKESWGGSTVDINPDATATVKIEYTPIRSGTFAARVYQGLFDQGVLLSEDSITIAESKVSESHADLSFDIRVDNALGSKILGNKAHVKISVTNKSDVTYRGAIDINPLKWESDRVTYPDIPPSHTETVPALSTVEVERMVDGLQTGCVYSFRVFYQFSNTQYTANQAAIYNKYEIVPAYNTYDATGAVTAIEAIDSIAVDEGVVCVDLRGQNTVNKVVANDNPNVLYLLDNSASVPAGVTGNVVKGTVADSIRLTDGYDFYCPEPFIAKDIRYSRTFATGTDGLGGWVSLMLPFSAKRVSVTDGSADGKTIDWYHGEDDQDKDFWLRTFEGDKGGELQFADYAENTIDAYVPYIVAVPGDRWGEARNLAGKELLFSAKNTVVDKNRLIPQEGDRFRFSGTLQAVERSGFWRLTGDGDKFVRSEGTIMPFRAVLTLKETGSMASDTLDVPPLGEAAAITLPSVTTSPIVSLVRLDGTRVDASTGRLPQGIYISRGKKAYIAR